MTSPGRRGGNGAEVSKRAAEMRAKDLASIVRSVREAGFVTHRAMAHELNVRKIPTVRGGTWHRTSGARVLERLNKQQISIENLPCERQNRRRREACAERRSDVGGVRVSPSA